MNSTLTNNKMKQLFNKIHTAKFLLIASALILLISANSCKEEEMDSTPPGPVTVIETEATYGGAIIEYQLPDDSDLLYVRAEYTNALGENVFKVGSRYTNSVEIDGFIEAGTYPVNLYAVDQANNKSEATAVDINPLQSFIYLVQESIELQPDLGGVKVSWENPLAKTVFVYLYYNDGSKENERILSSGKTGESFVIRGMDSISYDFSVVVEDFEGNKTDKVFIDRLKPLFEEKIDKTPWTLESALSVDGNAWEGETVNFWDDVVDTRESPADNSYFIINRDNNGGILNFPLDIVIDLNKQIILNRFVVWQRAFWYTDGSNGASDNYYYYQNENMRSFDLFASNDKQEWRLLGSFDIGDPKDEDGNIPADKIQEAIDGHEFELGETSEPFRYLKFSITSGYGSETNVYGSEITLYGLDNVGNN